MAKEIAICPGCERRMIGFFCDNCEIFASVDFSGLFFFAKDDLEEKHVGSGGRFTAEEIKRQMKLRAFK